MFFVLNKKPFLSSHTKSIEFSKEWYHLIYNDTMISLLSDAVSSTTTTTSATRTKTTTGGM